MRLTWANIISVGVVVGLLAMFAAFPSVAEPLENNDLIVMNQSISIEDAVNVALENSPTIASRRALLDVVAARVGMAKSMLGPQVSTSAFASTGNMPMVFSGPENVQPQNILITSDRARFGQNLMAMYPLYTGGRIIGQVNSAQALQQASTYDVTTSELDVALAVKNAYYLVLLGQHYIAAFEQRVTESQERVRIAEDSFSAGRIAKYDLLRNQTELADAQQQVNNAQRDVDLALVDLKNMMGIAQTSQLALSQQFDIQTVVPALDELQITAIKHRPEVAAIKARVRSSEENIKVAKSAYKPQVYATAMVDLSISRSNEMGNGFEKGYLLGVAAAVPLFDGGLRKSAVLEAQAMLQQMKADERDTTLSVSKSVASSYVQFDAATKNIILAQAAITQAEEDYRVIRMRYEAGKAINVEVLDALAALTRSRTTYAEVLYNQNVARQAIARAVGER